MRKLKLRRPRKDGIIEIIKKRKEGRKDASNNWFKHDTNQVERRMYCFHESLPASRPPPVAFSPPKAPPISAPFVGMFTFTIPQSLPCGLQ